MSHEVEVTWLPFQLQFSLRTVELYGKGGRTLNADVPTMSQEAPISTTSKLLLRRCIALTHCMTIIALKSMEKRMVAPLMEQQTAHPAGEILHWREFVMHARDTAPSTRSSRRKL